MCDGEVRTGGASCEVKDDNGWLGALRKKIMTKIITIRKTIITIKRLRGINCDNEHLDGTIGDEYTVWYDGWVGEGPLLFIDSWAYRVWEVSIKRRRKGEELILVVMVEVVTSDGEE